MAKKADAPDPGATAGARALEVLPSASVVTDAEQRVLSPNAAFLRMTGYREAELLGRNCRMLQGAGTDAATVTEMRDRLTAGLDYHGEVLNYRADGSPFWNRLSISPVRDAAGAVTGFVSAQSDVTTEVEARRRETEQRETAELLLEVAGGLATATRRGTVAQTIADAMVRLGFDRSAVALLDDSRGQLRMAAVAGWPPDLAAGARSYRASAGEHPELADVLAHPRQLLVTGRTGSETTRREFAAFRVSGYLVTPVAVPGNAPHGLLLGYWTAVPDPVASPLLAERLAGIAGLAAVAVENADLIEQIRRDADEDPLTGLATRTALHQVLARRLARSEGGRTAVVYGDIDRFKRVNDALGHPGGDELLRQVARRLRAVARPGDTVARPGGDEFVVVLVGISDDSDVASFVERVEQNLRGPFRIGDRRLYATMSLGWASAPAAGGSPTEGSPKEAAADLLKSADARMYEAKRRRRSTPTDSGGQQGLALDTDLHDAVARGDITAAFQAQYDPGTGRLTGFEALARWRHPQLGAVPPSLFIPLAEDNGLIHALGGQILDQACRFADRAAAQHSEPLRMQVNVSTRELAEPGFTARTLDRLGARVDRTWRLGLEVTESALILDRPRVEAALRQLREHGVGIAIDDFGSGYSSLSQLQELPATELKIDRAFIQREGALGTSVLRAIIALGSSLRLEVVAEGVETEEQLGTLRQLACDHIQGFLLSPPLPADRALSAPATIEEALRLPRS